MYIFPDMIDMGLRDGKSFPTDAHRQVAINLAIQNPNVTTLDAMTEIVDKVCEIPDDKIKTYTVTDASNDGILY